MLLLLLASAHAKPLTSAEFDDTAHTLGPGQNQIDVFRTSQFAITDQVELKTILLGGIGEGGGWITGPNVGVEYAIQEGKQGALSVQGHLATSWLFGSQRANAGVNYTLGGPKTNRLNVRARVGVTSEESDGERVNAMTSLLYVSAHWYINTNTTWRFYGGVDPVNTVLAETYVGNFGAEWTHAWQENWRIAAGLQYRDTTVIAQGLNRVNIATDNLPPVMPLPSVNLWYFW